MNEPYLDVICLGSMEETMKKNCGTKGYYIKIYQDNQCKFQKKITYLKESTNKYVIAIYMYGHMTNSSG